MPTKLKSEPTDPKAVSTTSSADSLVRLGQGLALSVRLASTAPTPSDRGHVMKILDAIYCFSGLASAHQDESLGLVDALVDLHEIAASLCDQYLGLQSSTLGMTDKDLS